LKREVRLKLTLLAGFHAQLEAGAGRAVVVLLDTPDLQAAKTLLDCLG
jgi:hypothetical protein